MARGKLYEVKNEGQLRWSFFSDDMVYLAGFSQRASAESYGGMVGYEIADPQLVNASVFDKLDVSSRDRVLDIRANSPIPKNLATPAKTAPAAPPVGAPRIGGRMGRRF